MRIFFGQQSNPPPPPPPQQPILQQQQFNQFNPSLQSHQQPSYQFNHQSYYHPNPLYQFYQYQHPHLNQQNYLTQPQNHLNQQQNHLNHQPNHPNRPFIHQNQPFYAQQHQSCPNNANYQSNSLTSSVNSAIQHLLPPSYHSIQTNSYGYYPYPFHSNQNQSSFYHQPLNSQPINLTNSEGYTISSTFNPNHQSQHKHQQSNHNQHSQSHPSKRLKSNHNSQIDHPNNFRCDTCQVKFNNLIHLTSHLNQHIQCDYEGCQFKAVSNVLEIHKEDRHLIFRPAKSPNSSKSKTLDGPINATIKGLGYALKTDQQVLNWIEERKKRWPTRKVIEEKEKQKLAELEQKKQNKANEKKKRKRNQKNKQSKTNENVEQKQSIESTGHHKNKSGHGSDMDFSDDEINSTQVTASDKLIPPTSTSIRNESNQSNSNLSSDPPPSQPPAVCSLWKAGWCLRGSRCWFLHPKDQLGSDKKNKQVQDSSQQQSYSQAIITCDGISSLSKVPSDSNSKIVCATWKSGWCLRGARCWFLHPKAQLGSENPNRQALISQMSGSNSQDAINSQRLSSSPSPSCSNSSPKALSEKPHSTVVCRLWKSRRCKRGDRCWFLHPKDQPGSNTRQIKKFPRSQSDSRPQVDQSGLFTKLIEQDLEQDLSDLSTVINFLVENDFLFAVEDEIGQVDELERLEHQVMEID
ncbi:hypothetical protein O181_024763 [Austropuccinia psidii MF-1]|uniref:C3H1-type domain-containing protein n=1 Tax=Austropuccinia psidii MF-1 TaxID=1389203 RepID=A0A9Q3GYH5_9BASI|nr:hypothetical protein [Austropuccinia psidii MF-1]